MRGTENTIDVEALDPRDYLTGNRRIVVDTSALLESREGYEGGVLQLVLHNADALTENPLVIPRAVLNELTNQTSPRRAQKDPELAKRADLARALVRDLVSDGLATTDFGGTRDFEADSEFRAIAEVASRMGWEVLFLTADITVKLEVRLLGKNESKAHTAGVATVNGIIEVESPALMLRKGLNKKKSLSDKGGKVDEYDRLSAVLKEWPDAFGLRRQVDRRIPTQRTHSRKPQQPATPFAASTTLRPLDEPILVKVFPGEGDEVIFRGPGSNGQIVLGERIARGKEGSVYEIDGEPHLLAKIFKRGKVTTHRKQKVELMVHHEVRLPGVCFPESVLSYGDEFVGFTMRRAGHAYVLNDTIFIPQELDRLYPDWTRRDLVDVCLSFLKRVKSLHDLNILIGDINPNNVMLGSQKDAWIIDADSVQVDGYPCPVGWDEFTAPEILGGVQGLRSIEQENFAVAVLLFMIMMTGTFPYENSGSDDTVQNIKSGLFPYGFDGKSERDLQPPSRWLYVWSHLSYQLKDLFWNSFHRDGSRYQPDKRVNVVEWIEAFEGFRKNLQYHDVDPQSLEIFPIRRKAEKGAELLGCPLCGGQKLIAQYSVGDDPSKEFRTPSACNRCLPKCESCGEPREPETVESGLCRKCRKSHTKEIERVKRESRKALREADLSPRTAENARRNTDQSRQALNPSRLCEQCGKPYISYGEIGGLTQRGIPIRPGHKPSDPKCVPPARNQQSTTKSPSSTTSSPNSSATRQAATPRPETLWQRISNWFRNR